jgi:hypothetical protein
METTATTERPIFDLIPEAYRTIRYRAILVSFKTTDGQQLFRAITVDHCGIAGIGNTRKVAVDDLTRKIVLCIVDDLESNDAIQMPLQPASEADQFASSFLKRFVDGMKKSKEVTDVHCEAVLCQELSSAMYE